MEIKFGLDMIRAHWHNDRMTSVVSSSTASTNVSLCGEDVYEFALSLIAPLGAEDNRDRLQTG